MSEHKHESTRVMNVSGQYKGAIGNAVDLAEYLAHGGDANSWAAGLHAGSPLLHAAIMYDDVEIVKLLLKHGASKTMKDEAGRTAKEVAELTKAKDEIKKLIA